MAVTIGGMVLLLGTVAVVLSHGTQRITGSNGTPNPDFARVLRPGATFCQGAETIPAGTGLLRIRAGTYNRPGAPLSVRVTRRGRTVTQGGLARGWTQGDVAIPVAPLTQTMTASRVCLHHAGPGRLALAGYRHRVRFEYLDPQRSSWWSFIPTLAGRFDEGKSAWYGDWSIWLVFVLMAAVCGLVAWVLVRESP